MAGSRRSTDDLEKNGLIALRRALWASCSSEPNTAASCYLELLRIKLIQTYSSMVFRKSECAGDLCHASFQVHTGCRSIRRLLYAVRQG